MKSRKHTQLKRHPLVRFIRGIFRLFRVLIKPKQQKFRAVRDERIDDRQKLEIATPQLKLESPQLEIATPQLEREAPALDLDRSDADRLITVGALFAQIKWQFPSETISDPRMNSRTHDVSRN